MKPPEISNLLKVLERETSKRETLHTFFQRSLVIHLPQVQILLFETLPQPLNIIRPWERTLAFAREGRIPITIMLMTLTRETPWITKTLLRRHNVRSPSIVHIAGIHRIPLDPHGVISHKVGRISRNSPSAFIGNTLPSPRHISVPGDTILSLLVCYREAIWKVRTDWPAGFLSPVNPLRRNCRQLLFLYSQLKMTLMQPPGEITKELVRRQLGRLERMSMIRL